MANVSEVRMDAVPAPATMEEYIAAVDKRRALFQPSAASRETHRGYAVEPVGAAPHAAHIHAMALVQDASILLSGGSDGYVRWYDLYASLNGKNMLTQNLRNSFVEGVTKGGVLTTWWGNAEAGPANGGAAGGVRDARLAAVHSLACQRDGLWGVCGGETGQINLWGLRHAAGVTRHVFRRHTAPVSALALSPTEDTLVSGGWDRGVHEWDLNTGQVVRTYDWCAGQVSNIAFRPLERPRGQMPQVAVHPEAAASTEAPADAASPDDVELEVELDRSLREAQEEAGEKDEGKRKDEAEEPAPMDTDTAAGEEEHDAVLDSDAAEDDADDDADSLFGGDRDKADGEADAEDGEAVSYTHLTLPTICSV